MSRSALSHLSHLLLALLLATLPQVRAENIPLPDIGASAGSLLTPAEEERIGRQFMRSVRGSLPVMDDPVLADYIEQLGQRLAARSDSPQQNFHFFLVNQPVVNAFAGPAGHIGVYTGLILATESESELASVVAHEIAHVTQHHLVRTFENASRMSGPMAALLIAAIVLGTQVSGDAGIAAAAGIQAAAVQQQINFTRENEKEADRVGMQILAESEFDPHAMPVFFERLAKSSRLYENNAPEFLRTHPVTTNRIADALGRAEGYPYRQVPESASYFLVRAYLREKAIADPQDAVKHFEGTLKQGRYRDQDAERYGYALALLRAHQPGKAREESRKLIAKSPANVAYLLLDARVDAELGQPERALKNLAAALELFPGNYPLATRYAELSLAQGQGAPAAPVLDQAIERRPDEPLLYRLRSQVAAASGNRGEAHLFLAEAHQLNGQLESAIQQLETALRTEQPDFYLASRMQAKLKTLKSELKTRKEAEKRR